MNTIQRFAHRLLGIEQRSAPVSTLSNPQQWLLDALGFGNQSSSGITVSPERALGLPVVFSCVRVRSETMASLPVALYEQLSNGDIKPATDRPEHEVLAYNPHAWYSAYTFKEVMQTYMDMRGNAYAQILRNGRGELTGLKIMDAARTTSFLYKDALWHETYSIDPEDLTRYVIPDQDMLHLVGPGGNGIVGRTPISILRETVGGALAGQDLINYTYKNKSHIGGFLSTDSILSPEQVKTNKDSWKDQYAGMKNAGSTPVLMGGFRFVPITLSPADAQFVQTANLATDQICGAYRVPPHKVAKLDRATFSNIEHQSLEFGQDCVLPMVTQWEDQLNRKIIAPRLRGRFFYRFNVDAILRADLLTRYRAHAIALNWGIMNRDEVRKLENRNRIPDSLGAQFMTPLNMGILGDTPDPAADPKGSGSSDTNQPDNAK